MLKMPLRNRPHPRYPGMGTIHRPMSLALNLFDEQADEHNAQGHHALHGEVDPAKTTTWCRPTAMMAGIAARLRMTWRLATERNLPRVPMAKMATTIGERGSAPVHAGRADRHRTSVTRAARRARLRVPFMRFRARPAVGNAPSRSVGRGSVRQGIIDYGEGYLFQSSAGTCRATQGMPPTTGEKKLLRS